MNIRLKTLLLALAAVLISLPIFANPKDPHTSNWPYDFKADGFYFNKINNTQNVAINGIYSKPEHLIVPSTVEYEGVTYTVTELNKFCLATACGPGYFDHTTYAYNYDTKKITIPETVTSIDGLGFSGIINVTEIDFPESLISFYYYNSNDYPGHSPMGPFMDCRALKEVTLPKNLKVLGGSLFEGCTSVETVNVLAPITYISGSVFSDCPNLKTINFSDLSHLRTIGGCAFKGCNATILEHFEFPASLKTIGEEAFRETPIKEVVLPAGLTEVGMGAFSFCPELTSVTIGEGPKVFSCTFMHCPKLAEVKLPESTTQLQFTFFNCPQLSEINLPSNITKIGTQPFGMTKISSIQIPSSVQQMAYDALANCAALTSIDFLDSPKVITFFNDDENKYYIDENFLLKSWQLSGSPNVQQIYVGRSLKNYSFSGFRKTLKNLTFGPEVKYIYDSQFADLSLITTISIPGKVETIGKNAFRGCTGLTNLSLSSSLTEIGENAFEGNPNLAKVSVPDKVETIGANAFKGCTGLTNLYLGASLRQIGNNAFEDDRNLAIIESANPTPPDIFSETFLRVDKYSCEVYVPVGNAERYRYADYWNAFRTFKEKDYSGISDTVADGTAVRLEGGRIVLIGGDTRVTVYTADGRLVADRRLSSGESLELPSRGLYIVTAAGRSFKICY